MESISSSEKKPKKEKKRTSQDDGDDVIQKKKSRHREEISSVTEEIVEVEDTSSAVVTTFSEQQKRKELPPGYVCKACNNPGHAIYDCPAKLAKKMKEPKKTIFMSHLPAKWTRANVVSFLGSNGIPNEKISNISMIMGGEGEEKIFKGVALVTVVGLEPLSKILQLNGELVVNRAIVVKINEPKPKNAIKKRCFRCGEAHNPITCNNPRVCYRCKGTGHLSTECPKKSK